MNTGTRTERPAAATAAASEQLGPGLGRQDARRPGSRRDVLSTLLGRNNLSASDLSGNDPYNSTGKFFRR